MSFGKPRNPTYSSSEPARLSHDIKLLYGLMRARATPSTIVQPFMTGARTAAAPTGYNALSTTGGTMLGPFAVNPQIKQISRDGSNRGHIDISRVTGAFSSNILPGWNTGTNPPNSLSYIDGGAYDGQTEYILVPATITAVFKYNGNIQTIGLADYTVTGPAKVAFMFDSTIAAPDGISQGSWLMFATGGLVVGSFANRTLSNLQGPTSINQSLIPQGGITLGNSINFYSAGYISDIFMVDTNHELTVSGGNIVIRSPVNKSIRMQQDTTDKGIFDFISNKLSLQNAMFFEILPTGGQPFQVLKLTGLAAEFSCFDGFQFDNSVLFKAVPDFEGGFTLSANSGGANLPAKPAGFITVKTDGGGTFKIPVYNP
jgi:hypothetical protein